jgi:threonine synthase
MNELRCGACGAAPASAFAWRCESCASPLEIELPPADPATLIDPAASGIWRYRGWLPDVAAVSLGEPTTALVDVRADGRRVIGKMEGGLPTGSFKDRGSAVLVAWLRQRGARELVADSSGNAGASIAAYAARAGLAARIFVPADASPAKLIQVRAAGATLVAVPGPRAGAAAAAIDALSDEGVAYASHLWQPAFLAGTATFAYEVFEALGRRAPATLIAPLGGGTLLLGAALGFARLAQAGLIDRPPRLVGVQSTACAPLADAFAGCHDDAMPVEPGTTLAEGIRIARPPRSRQILAAIRATDGTIVSVDDDAIRASLSTLLSGGIFVEPTSAVAHAGAARIGETPTPIVLAFTGHGLKAAATISGLL